MSNRHKGTEFSTAKKTLAENQSSEQQDKQRGNEFSRSSDQWQKNKDEQTRSEDRKRPTDYWDRIADDVASGYKNNSDEDSMLNEDEEPGDHEKGD